MIQVPQKLRIAIKMTCAVFCVALAVLWTGWHQQLRAQGYYTRQVSHYTSNGPSVNGSLFDTVTGTNIYVSATQVETQGRRPRSTTTSTTLYYSQCQTFGSVFHCDQLNGSLANGGLEGGGNGRSLGPLVLNVDTSDEPDLFYCFYEFDSGTGQSQSGCPGPLPGFLQGDISVTFTQEGENWSSFIGTTETHSTNFLSRSRGTQTTYQATMTGEILGVEIGQPGWYQSSSIGTNDSVDMDIQIGPSP